MKNGPQAVNNYITKSNGFLTLRDISNTTFPPSDPMGDLTMDFSLKNEIKITQERIEVGINATFFNKDTGYIIPDITLPPMPTFDP
jgi:hypothetical protein